MSSSAEPAGRRGIPRVGIMRGVTAGGTPVLADVRRNLPTEVLDPDVLTAIRTAAQQEGYADGYAAGLAEADQQGAAARAEQARQLAGVMAALVQAVDELRQRDALTLADVADQAAALAVEVARAVLQRELATATDPGRDAIARAIGLAPAEGDVRVHLNPADRAALGPTDDLAPGRVVTLVADPAIAPGDAVLHVGATRVDAQVEPALERVTELLRGGRS